MHFIDVGHQFLGVEVHTCDEFSKMEKVDRVFALDIENYIGRIQNVNRRLCYLLSLHIYAIPEYSLSVNYIWENIED